MENPKKLIPILLLVSSLSAAVAVAGRRRPLVPALFVFGDSQLDAGNNFHIRNTTTNVNFPPYGETFFRRPTGRFTNGRTIADFLAMHLGLPMPRPSLEPGVSFINGLNFASGGSGLLDSTSLGEAVVPISAQVVQFRNVVAQLRSQLGELAAQKLLSQAMFIAASGSNDLGLNYLQNATMQQQVPPAQFIASAMAEYKNTITALYQEGARRLAVFELGLLGCTPSARLVSLLRNQTGCFAIPNQLALMFNQELSKLLDELRTQLPHMRITYAKTFGIFSNLTEHALHFGFKETAAACCGAGPLNAAVGCGVSVPPGYPYEAYRGKFPSKYLFWDGSHPTQAAYSHVFKRVWSGGTDAIQPLSLRDLASVAIEG